MAHGCWCATEILDFLWRIFYPCASGTPIPGPYGPYAPPPAPYGSYPPPPPYPPPPYGSYPPYAYPPPPPAASAPSYESEAAETIQATRPKRLEWTTTDEEKLVLYLPVTYLFWSWFLLGFFTNNIYFGVGSCLGFSLQGLCRR